MLKRHQLVSGKLNCFLQQVSATSLLHPVG